MDYLNKAVLDRFPGTACVFHSADFIPTSEKSGHEDAILNYPIEYLNKINGSGLLPAKLDLKLSCPVTILKNLDQLHAVCNRSRGILTRCSNRVLEIRLLTGQHAGQTVFIPSVYNQPTEDQGPFNFARKQFPVRLCFSIVSRPMTASTADAPPTRSGVEDPARIASLEVCQEPARAIYGLSVVVRGSG